ncbi:MAG: hypothetical protein QGG25_06705 [Phycisphaerae bacterium]|nr:hypothetical protein [Phycisphaerae bacterium]
MTTGPQPPTSTLALAIHGTPVAASFVVTGAGSRVIEWLLGEAGSSRTVLDAQIPYARAALSEYTGADASQHVSIDEAGLMAEAAYWRALRLDAKSNLGKIGARPIAGVSCTATIATDRLKRGEHRAHFAIRVSGRSITASLFMNKGLRDRDGEEEIVSRALLNLLAEACGLSDRLPLELDAAESFETTEHTQDDPTSRIVAGKADLILIRRDGLQQSGSEATPAKGRTILPGSFNPLHDGHLELVNHASQLTGKAPAMELSIRNVDKPPIPLNVVEARIAQMRGEWDVVLTNAPTFAEKSRVLPYSTFVIGHDTAIRLVDDDYYPAYDAAADPEKLGTAWGAAMSEIRRNGCDFVIAGRLADGEFRTLPEAVLPNSLRDMIRILPEAEFRSDESSTALRGEHQA